MQRRGGWSLLALLVLAIALGAGSCGGRAESSTAAAATGSSGELAVFAAASLTESFPRIDAAARYSFAGSDELATQIRQGAPADVYAAANARYPDELHAEGLVEEPSVFATNRLVLIVPAENPAGIDTYEDVAGPGVKLVVAAEGVPVGDYTREVLATLHLEGALDNVVSNEDDVKGVVAKVALGEADAGLVYSTDAAAAREDVTVIELPEGSQPPIEYKIAVVSDTDAQQAAKAFVDRVLSEEGQVALREAGFGPPETSWGNGQGAARVSAPRRQRDLSTGEWAALALLVERPAHGFAVARALAPEGEVGRVWSLTRPLVYRALELLEREGLVERRGTVPGDGPARTVLAPTRKGRRRLARWLEDPVEHVRDARSELMLKLLYLDRAGADPSALLEAQLDALAPVEGALAERVASSDGFERTLALWRLESTRALARVAAALLEATSPASPRSP